jgi:hypothetical protein
LRPQHRPRRRSPSPRPRAPRSSHPARSIPQCSFPLRRWTFRRRTFRRRTPLARRWPGRARKSRGARSVRQQDRSWAGRRRSASVVTLAPAANAPAL